MRMIKEVVGHIKKIVNLLRVSYFLLYSGFLFEGTFILDNSGVLKEQTVYSPILQKLFTDVLGSLVTSELDVLLDLIQFGNYLEWLPLETILVINSPDFFKQPYLRDRPLSQLIFSTSSLSNENLFISFHISCKVASYLPASVCVKLFKTFCHTFFLFFGTASLSFLVKGKVRLGNNWIMRDSRRSDLSGGLT